MTGLLPGVGRDDHIQGGEGATLTLVEYGDYECPYCGQAYPIVKRLRERIGAPLRFVFRNFRLAQIHPNAMAAAEMAEAAGFQGQFWEMHDTLFEHQRALRGADLAVYARELALKVDELQSSLQRAAERVRKDFASGVRSGVNGTPTFFINGARFDGDWSDEDGFAESLGAHLVTR